MSSLRTYPVAPNLPNTLALQGSVRVELVTDDGAPVANEACEILLPGESEPRTCITDKRGTAWVVCPLKSVGDTAEIRFPNLPDESWEAEVSGG